MQSPVQPPVQPPVPLPPQKLSETGRAGRRKAEAEFDEYQVISAYMQQIDEDYVFPAGDSSSQRYQKEPVFSDTL